MKKQKFRNRETQNWKTHVFYLTGAKPKNHAHQHTVGNNLYIIEVLQNPCKMMGVVIQVPVRTSNTVGGRDRRITGFDGFSTAPDSDSLSPREQKVLEQDTAPQPLVGGITGLLSFCFNLPMNFLENDARNKCSLSNSELTEH